MKKYYIQPKTNLSGLKIEVVLHQASNARIFSNTTDYDGADSGLGVDNEGGDVIMSSKNRGFYDDSEW